MGPPTLDSAPGALFPDDCLSLRDQEQQEDSKRTCCDELVSDSLCKPPKGVDPAGDGQAQEAVPADDEGRRPRAGKETDPDKEKGFSMPISHLS